MQQSAALNSGRYRRGDNDDINRKVSTHLIPSSEYHYNTSVYSIRRMLDMYASARVHTLFIFVGVRTGVHNFTWRPQYRVLYLANKRATSLPGDGETEYTPVC